MIRNPGSKMNLYLAGKNRVKYNRRIYETTSKEICDRNPEHIGEKHNGESHCQINLAQVYSERM